MKRSLILYVLVVLVLYPGSTWAETKVTKVNPIPKKYSLTFKEAMSLLQHRAIIVCKGVDGRYAMDGTGYGLTGRGMIDSWMGTRTFQVFLSGQSISSPFSKTTLRWSSSLTKENSRKPDFRLQPKDGLDHIQVKIYHDSKLDVEGNYYLKTVQHVTEKKNEIIVPSGRVEKLLPLFVRGTEAEVIFEVAKTETQSDKVGVTVSGELVAVESSSETAHADTEAKAIRVSVKDDGKSIMFPGKQKVIVLTITEKLIVDKSGRTVRRVSIDRSEEMLLTINKVRPDKKGVYKW